MAGKKMNYNANAFKGFNAGDLVVFLRKRFHFSTATAFY
jgi:hypothetical protein